MRSSARMEAQDPLPIIDGLMSFPGRGAGTDAERRAAAWLVDRLTAAGADVSVETFWCRPNWAAAHLWHIALAVAGSLIALASPIAGLALLAIALVSVAVDAVAGVSPGRRLTPERASQNVVAVAAGDTPSDLHQTRLLITANYDVGRTGLAYRRSIRGSTATLARALHGATPGWLAWLAFAITWLVVIAALRQAGHHSGVIGAIQFPPTVGLVLAFAFLLELATGDWSPGANDNASGVSLALALARALQTTPPRHLKPELVLTGAGDVGQIGLRRYLRSHRAAQSPPRRRMRHRRASVVALGIGPSGSGTVHWWQSDGAFLPLRFGASLRRIAQQIGRDEPHLAARPHRGRGSAGAYAARTAGLPALTIGCLDERGLPPRSHQKTDTAATIDPHALDRVMQFALLLVDGIDAAVGDAQGATTPTPA